MSSAPSIRLLGHTSDEAIMCLFVRLPTTFDSRFEIVPTSQSCQKLSSAHAFDVTREARPCTSARLLLHTRTQGRKKTSSGLLAARPSDLCGDPTELTIDRSDVRLSEPSIERRENMFFHAHLLSSSFARRRACF